MIRIAVVGSASAGKSSVANAVFGTAFPVDARSGSTRDVLRATVGDVEILDAPPDALPEADAYLMVCDKDLTAIEFRQLRELKRRKRPVAVALNKADTYGPDQLHSLLGYIRSRVAEFTPANYVVPCSADPVRLVTFEHSDGRITEHLVPAEADVESVSAAVLLLVGEAGASVRVRSREISRRLAASIRDKLLSDGRDR